MKTIVFAFFFGFCFLLPVVGAAQDTPETRLQAAQRYVAVISMAEQVNDIFAKLSLQVPPEQRDELIAYLHNNISVDRVENIMITEMAKHFTTEELDALADFYSSPIGRSIQQKWDNAIKESQKLVLQEIVAAVKAR